MRDRRVRLRLATLGCLVLAVAASGARGESPSEQAGAAPTTVVLVRHAEASRDGGRDPSLTGAGRERARLLAHVLAEAGVEALYASQYRRTRSTVEPLARQAGLEVRVDEIAGDVAAWAAGFARRLLATHRGETVVVAGHSNTVPALIEALGVPAAPPIAEHEHDGLFVVTVDADGGRLLRLRYGKP